MSAVSSLCLCWTLSLCLLGSVSAVQVNITAAPGQTVSLPCRAPSNTNITAVEWTRPGLEPQYVFLYRDGRSDPGNQLPSFKDRVELKDRQMKDGDVSLILKNVASNDTGTYECHVLQGETNRRKRATFNTEPISTIHLEVQSADEGKTGGAWIAPVAGAGAVAVVAAVVVGGVVWWLSHRSTDQSSYKPLADEESQ